MANASMTITTAFHPGPKKARVVSKDGSPHITDEIYNSLISSFGTLFSLVGSAYLIFKMWQLHNTWHVIGFVIYGFCAVNLFLSSALHHAIEGPDAIEEKLLKWDYMAIYAMIAGAMTPFCLVNLRETSGPTLLAIIWGLAFTGILLKAFWKNFPKWLEMIFYLAMGWMGTLVIYPVYKMLGIGPLAWLLAAGSVYSVGSVVYYSQRPNPVPGRFGFHEIWHLFVVVGSILHFYILYRYVAAL